MKGVQQAEVKLNQGYLEIKLQPHNQFDLFSLPKRIRDQGFTIKEILLQAKGDLLMREKNSPVFKVSGREDLIFAVQWAKKTGFPLSSSREGVIVTGRITTLSDLSKKRRLLLRMEKIEEREKEKN